MLGCIGVVYVGTLLPSRGILHEARSRYYSLKLGPLSFLVGLGALQALLCVVCMLL